MQNILLIKLRNTVISIVKEYTAENFLPLLIVQHKSKYTSKKFVTFF